MTLPIPRYTGANCFTAQDYAGNIFYAYQAEGDDLGYLIMIDPSGMARDITPHVAQGRPCLECNPSVGLKFVGNKETGKHEPPPRYDVPQYVPWPSGGQGIAGPPGAAGAGAVDMYDDPISCAAWDSRDLIGGALVDIPAAYGVESRPCYLVRFCGQATYPNVKIRAGSERSPHFLTLTTQAPGIRKDTQGWIPGPVAYISTVDGQAKVWLQIIGR
jgi:hypothetical protein